MLSLQAFMITMASWEATFGILKIGVFDPLVALALIKGGSSQEGESRGTPPGSWRMIASRPGAKTQSYPPGCCHSSGVPGIGSGSGRITYPDQPGFDPYVGRYGGQGFSSRRTDSDSDYRCSDGQTRIGDKFSTPPIGKEIKWYAP